MGNHWSVPAVASTTFELCHREKGILTLLNCLFPSDLTKLTFTYLSDYERYLEEDWSTISSIWLRDSWLKDVGNIAEMVQSLSIPQLCQNLQDIKLYCNHQLVTVDLTYTQVPHLMQSIQQTLYTSKIPPQQEYTILRILETYLPQDPTIPQTTIPPRPQIKCTSKILAYHLQVWYSFAQYLHSRQVSILY